MLASFLNRKYSDKQIFKYPDTTLCFVNWLIKKHSKSKIVHDQSFIQIQSFLGPLLELHNRWGLARLLNAFVNYTR